ncbi:putative 3',5'-cyclic phosphodiesterase pde-5 isoform X1 [Oratosquilla oratoria]|uniref:putative 3',5'-cyclic phosphodiesterase pde-5 isoform X1 n=2 Tax=Oratosquilla oratoria TaxID=337810 RepID=UPI003F757CEA
MELGKDFDAVEGEMEDIFAQTVARIQPTRRRRTGVPLAVNGRNKMNHFDHIPSQQVTGEMVGQYLRAHPEFLEAWLMEQVELETLERWMIRRTQRAQHKNQENGSNARIPSPRPEAQESRPANLGKPASKITRKTSLSRWKFCVHADKRKMLQELTQSLQVSPNKGQVLRELAHCIASACSAEEFNLYLLDTSTSSLIYCPDPKDDSLEENPWRGEVSPETWLCTFVASTKESVKTTIDEADPRFPLGIAVPANDAFYVISVPVVQSDGELIAVLELFRKEQGEAFHEEDEEIINSYMVWGGIALHYAELYHNMAKQRKLNDFILSVVKSIFQDMVSMDTLIMKVMNFAQKLVNADRASLFLVDSKNRELFARIFDMGNTFDENKPPQASKEIRFSIGTGIAGIVAQTGEVLSISDAYSDPRFNRHVDQQTGYVTKSILCMPIFIRGNVIGVMQMVNKKQGNFTKEDEESFEMFAVYCGLALHHAKLYDKIRRSEQKYKVALEVMSYHSSCGEDDLGNIVKEGIPDDIPGVDDYYFSHLSLDDMDKVRHAIYMFVDLFGLSRFDRDSLIRFTLTVKKNYRRVPYHNWTHGFSVANSMYTIIKHAPKTFRPLECLALYIGSLCHDLDHRGKNNKFMLETESPLAAIYTTSTLEHHHFNQTVTILQQEGHNIFSKLTPSEYKQVLGNIKHCILATDLALFFPNKSKLAQLLAENKFDWSNIEHRLLIEAIAMTACDLCASAKPWDVQVETVKVIFEEFYEQGDAEKAAGKSPIPMMDRDKTDEQPASQVGFLSGICIPCYELLFKVIPNTKPFLDGCKDNFSKWQALADTVQEHKKSENEEQENGKEEEDPPEEEEEKEVVDEDRERTEESGGGEGES